MLNALKGQPNGQQVLKWLSDSLEEELRTGVSLEGEAVYRQQGRCQVILEILETFDSCEKYLAKVASNEVRLSNKGRTSTVD